MGISDWIDTREMTGFPTFAYKDVQEAFPSLSAQLVSNTLYRLCKQRRIQNVHRQFYTVVPMQYRDRGLVPPVNYVGQLMAHLDRPYYISLLSAGVLHGAAHQKPQKVMVTTTLPKISTSNSQMVWTFRKAIPETLLQSANSETGAIKYSNPELTAVDVVQYSQLIGGLSVAATVLAELVEVADFSRNTTELLNATTLPTLQRLGYILDVVLDEQDKAEQIRTLLATRSRKVLYRPLQTDHSTIGRERNEKWKIIINQDIEPDDIW